MAKEVVWTLKRYNLLCEQGMLNEEDRGKLKMHIMRESNLAIAHAYHCDESKINDDINRYKMIYDAVQLEFPEVLEKRDPDIYRKKRKDLNHK